MSLFDYRNFLFPLGGGPDGRYYSIKGDGSLAYIDTLFDAAAIDAIEIDMICPNASQYMGTFTNTRFYFGPTGASTFRVGYGSGNSVGGVADGLRHRLKSTLGDFYIDDELVSIAPVIETQAFFGSGTFYLFARHVSAGIDEAEIDNFNAAEIFNVKCWKDLGAGLVLQRNLVPQADATMWDTVNSVSYANAGVGGSLTATEYP